MDVISRQAAIDVTWEEPTYTDTLNVLTEVRDKIRALPSAQPEIIHCRECKHWKTDHPTANGYHCCHRIHNAFPMREDDFCSRAERREE